MKTKEINVWYKTSSCIGGIGFDCFDFAPNGGQNYLKAILIVEVPDRKIEITESQLRATINTVISGCDSETVISAIFKEE